MGTDWLSTGETAASFLPAFLPVGKLAAGSPFPGPAGFGREDHVMGLPAPGLRQRHRRLIREMATYRQVLADCGESVFE